MTRRFLCVLVLLACIPCASVASTLRVPAQHANIQDALTAASPGDTVLVAAGTHTGSGNRNLDFKSKDLVLLSEAGAALTILDVAGSEENPGRGILLGTGLTSTTVVDGFTIVNGFMVEMAEPTTAAGPNPGVGGGGRHDLSGAGIMIRGFCSPTVRNCIIRNCASTFTGGGLGVELGATPRIENVIVTGCSAGIQGGGISVETGGHATLIDCVFTGNSSLTGGGGDFGPGEATVIGCLFAGNRADGRGGGINARLFTRTQLERTVVWGNCGSQGADMFVDPAIAGFDTTDFVRFECSLVDTTAIDDAGGVVEYVADNVFTDPSFCAAASCNEAPTHAGDYAVNDGSPALPENSPCGAAIGPLGSGCTSPVRLDSWSRLKARYRAGRPH